MTVILTTNLGATAYGVPSILYYTAALALCQADFLFFADIHSEHIILTNVKKQSII